MTQVSTTICVFFPGPSAHVPHPHRPHRLLGRALYALRPKHWQTRPRWGCVCLAFCQRAIPRMIKRSPCGHCLPHVAARCTGRPRKSRSKRKYVFLHATHAMNHYIHRSSPVSGPRHCDSEAGTPGACASLFRAWARARATMPPRSRWRWTVTLRSFSVCSMYTTVCSDASSDIHRDVRDHFCRRVDVCAPRAAASPSSSEFRRTRAISGHVHAPRSGSRGPDLAAHYKQKKPTLLAVVGCLGYIMDEVFEDSLRTSEANHHRPNSLCLQRRCP